MSTVLEEIDYKIFCFLYLLVIILQKTVYLNELQKHPNCLEKDEQSMCLKGVLR